MGQQQDFAVNGAVRHAGLAVIVLRPTNILSIRDRGEWCVIFDRSVAKAAHARGHGVRRRPRSQGHNRHLITESPRNTRIQVILRIIAAISYLRNVRITRVLIQRRT